MYPSLEGLPPHFVRAITELLALDLEIEVAGAYIHDESYWRRRSLETTDWINCQISEHGQSWKQLFFERYLQQELENFNPVEPNEEQLAELERKIKVIE